MNMWLQASLVTKLFSLSELRGGDARNTKRLADGMKSEKEGMEGLAGWLEWCHVSTE